MPEIEGLLGCVHRATQVAAVEITASNIRDVCKWIISHDGGAEVLNLGTMSSRSEVIAISTGECRLFAFIGDYVIWLAETTGDFTKMTATEFKTNYDVIGDDDVQASLEAND